MRNGGLRQFYSWRSNRPNVSELASLVTELKQEQSEMANDIRALQSASRLKDEQFDELKCELARLETIAFADAARAGLGA